MASYLFEIGQCSTNLFTFATAYGYAQTLSVIKTAGKVGNRTLRLGLCQSYDQTEVGWSRHHQRSLTGKQRPVYLSGPRAGRIQHGLRPTLEGFWLKLVI